jgi:hypothetical protein
VVKGSRFILESPQEFAIKTKTLIPEDKRQPLRLFLEKPFTPGECVMFLEENGICPKTDIENFLALLLGSCAEINDAEHGEGYWIDHWHYNLDLLESYLLLYPEDIKVLLFETKNFTYFDNDAVIAPRESKYVLLDGVPRQLHSVVHDAKKNELINSRADQKNISRTRNGTGDVFLSTLFTKLLCLFVNKYASLDPFGTGIEMEADKPNWYDSLNGLPALFGSSSCELFELKRLACFAADSLKNAAIKDLLVPNEIADFFGFLIRLTDEWKSADGDADFAFWQKSGIAKEEYRAKTRLGFSGSERVVAASDIIAGFETALRKIETGLQAGYDKTAGIYCSYFIHEVTEYETLPGSHIKPLQFRQKRLPFFLEGQMHALRTCDGLSKAKKLHEAVKHSELFDTKLQMYKVTASLGSMPEEIGRCRVFTPGWLENESIWLHMEYKYFLELLKRELYEEFFADFKKIMIPFQDPQRYGRSILENSSFLVSSAFPYRQLHGNGFVARLSGSTAEFIQIWLIMNAGNRPFSLDARGQLMLTLQPSLPGWLFKRKEKTYSFCFLGTTEVIYKNPGLKNTFGQDGCRISKLTVTDKKGGVTVIESGAIPSPLALRVRSGEISRIEALLS